MTTSSQRRRDAAERRNERESQRQRRELERRAKEQAKLSAIEQARLEVEYHQNQLDILLSIHKGCGEALDWRGLAAVLLPVRPAKSRHYETRAKCLFFAASMGEGNQAIEAARLKDDETFDLAVKAHGEELSEAQMLKKLAARVLAGEHRAYTDAITSFNPFAELSDLGSSIHFAVHNQAVIECAVNVNGQKAIPAEVKTLTTTGKVSVKPISRARFHEIYQDYVCSCVLRVAREVFALLPVHWVLVNAGADSSDANSSATIGQSVLSVLFDRLEFERLDFERLDPSDAIEGFLHKGDFKATRRTEAFQAIVPLSFRDIPEPPLSTATRADISQRVQSLRLELKSLNDELRPLPNAFAP